MNVRNKLYDELNDLKNTEKEIAKDEKNYKSLVKISFFEALGLTAITLAAPAAGMLVAIPAAVGTIGAFGYLGLKNYKTTKKLKKLQENITILQKQKLMETHGKELEKSMGELSSKIKRGF